MNSASHRPESPVAKLQEMLGNRAGMDRFGADLDRYQQLGGKDVSYPLDALLTSVGTARPAKTKPQFCGLSHELQQELPVGTAQHSTTEIASASIDNHTIQAKREAQGRVLSQKF